MPVNIPEGERMIDIFTSVGAREFVVTQLDLKQELIWARLIAPRNSEHCCRR
jgi:hypothetical protein